VIFTALIAPLSSTADKGRVANVEFAHSYLNQRHGINISANAHPKQIINMQYLLYLIDKANKGGTNHHTGPFSTKQIATDVAVRQAVDCLVTASCPSVGDIMTGGSCGGSPAGCWGGFVGSQAGVAFLNSDGWLDDFRESGATKLPDNFLNCVYGSQNAQVIEECPWGWCHDVTYGFLENAFQRQWGDLIDLRELPECFLANVSGAQGDNFLKNAFYGTDISTLPKNFLANLSGEQGNSFMSYTFASNWGETSIDEIPENFLSGISGRQGERFLDGTFSRSRIKSIPENFLSKVTGSKGELFMVSTFERSALEVIPEGFLSGVKEVVAQDDFVCFVCDTFKDTPLHTIHESFMKNVTRVHNSRFLEKAFLDTHDLKTIPNNFLAGLEEITNDWGFLLWGFNDSGVKAIPDNFLPNLKRVENSRGRGILFQAFLEAELETIGDNFMPSLISVSGSPNWATEFLYGAFMLSNLKTVGNNFIPSLEVVEDGGFLSSAFDRTPVQTIGSGFLKNLREARGPGFLYWMFRQTNSLAELPDDFVQNVEVASAREFMAIMFMDSAIARTPRNFLPKLGGSVGSEFFREAFSRANNIATISFGSYAISAPVSATVFPRTFLQTGGNLADNTQDVWLWYNTMLQPIIYSSSMFNGSTWVNVPIDSMGLNTGLDNNNRFIPTNKVRAVYVPANLLEDYKNSPNWTAVADKFVAIKCSDILGAPANGVPHRALVELQAVVGDVDGTKWAEVVANGYCE